MDLQHYFTTLCLQAKQSSKILARASTEQKNTALVCIADAIEANAALILQANQQDLAQARAEQLEPALLERLMLNEKAIEQMQAGIRQIVLLQDPIGQMNDFNQRPSGILLGKMRVPLGVVGMIYESRPNVTADAAALCLKSGNAVILRGGKEALQSNLVIMQCIKEGLIKAELPEHCIQLMEYTDRSLVTLLVQAQGSVDVIIPRGGKGLITRVMQDARLPVIKHLDGNCHIYIDEYAKFEDSLAITLNAKTQRYGTCNTTESLLIHQAVATEFLPKIMQALQDKGVELRVCGNIDALYPNLYTLANEDDWYTEYLAPILAIKIVSSIDEAIEHINYYGSHHTDAILTQNYDNSQRFIREIDSASVLINASTRFADGFEYGLGAEIGISTDKIHVRGPVGLEGLTSQKWIVFGAGQTRK